MAIDFRPRDFLQPVALARYRLLLERAQWWPAERIEAFHAARVGRVLAHVATHVPYYRRVLDEAGLTLGDFRTPADLRRLPTLTKPMIAQLGDALVSRQAARFRPVSVTSTGTTGPAVSVLLDRQSNGLEFAFYWRHWGWFGYRLGDRFAQLVWAPFRGARADDTAIVQRGTGRLLLNALSLSHPRAAGWAAAMTAHRARFLKGHPSALLHFALFVREGRLPIPPLRAIFATGEVLEAEARTVIEDVFGAPVANAYGTMERVVAACECPAGRMHVNSDYGLWQAEDAGLDPVTHMPLVRYDLGDLVERGPDGPCPCGRALPTIGRVFGRSVDAITTPDGRVITAAAIVFNVVPNILRGQLVQEDRARLHARVLPSDSYTDTDERRLAAEITRLVGPSMTVTIERVAGPDAFGGPGEKHRAVVSPLTRAAVARGQPIA